jgi:hypothetical protein
MFHRKLVTNCNFILHKTSTQNKCEYIKQAHTHNFECGEGAELKGVHFKNHVINITLTLQHVHLHSYTYK